MTGAGIINPRRDALVLSGGGIRFATHVGVMAEMDTWTSDDGVKWLDRFPVVVGTSAGALYGALYASGLSPAQIAIYARFFANEKIGPRLFDRNIAGAAAAFLEHNTSYLLGAVRGFSIQTLLETVFSTEMHAELRAFDPRSPQSDVDALCDRLQAAWQVRRRRPRDAEYFKDQVTFETCHDRGRELFLIGTNAYNGQKTVFAYRPNQGNWPAEQAEDAAMYASPPWLNPPTDYEIARAEDALRQEQPPINTTLEFRRFENRVYRAYDPELYGRQMPLALAVRASVSVPIIFEPLRIARWKGPDAAEASEDLFIDGGIDDNFSLSVALDPHLGHADRVFGVALGNLGARLTDKHAGQSMLTILLKTTEYMGDTVQDLGGMTSRLADHKVTVLDAMTGKSAQITDTKAIGELIDEGRDIARAFWMDRNGDVAYPSAPQPMPIGLAFPSTPEAIFLSPAARAIDPPQPPTPLRRVLPTADVWTIRWGELRIEWRLAYVLLGLFALGFAGALAIIIESIGDGIRGSVVAAGGRIGWWLGLSVVVFIGLVLTSRIGALAFWRGRDR